MDLYESKNDSKLTLVYYTFKKLIQFNENFLKH